MKNKLFCDNCGFEEDELYLVDDKKYCDDCLDSLGIITVHTVKSYCANGEWFDDYEEAVEYADIKILK